MGGQMNGLVGQCGGMLDLSKNIEKIGNEGCLLELDKDFTKGAIVLPAKVQPNVPEPSFSIVQRPEFPARDRGD